MKKILIADDEPDILKVVKFRLIKAGYEIMMAVNGKEAIELVQKIKPDLVLLDFSMPLMNGDEVCKQIKADPLTKHIPVIMMTASTERAHETHIKMIGADDRLLKPFEPEDLIEKVEKFVR